MKKITLTTLITVAITSHVKACDYTSLVNDAASHVFKSNQEAKEIKIDIITSFAPGTSKQVGYKAIGSWVDPQEKEKIIYISYSNQCKFLKGVFSDFTNLYKGEHSKNEGK